MPTKTNAYVLAEKDAPFTWSEVELADPEANEVLIKVVACGLCATDLHVQSGAFPSPFPNITGHEGSGKVLKVGSAVTRVKEGDSVLLSFNYCSQCGPCQEEHPAACEQFGACNFGRVRSAAVGNKAGVKAQDGSEVYGAFFGQSAFANHALVVENSVVKVPEGTDLVALSPLGCGMQTGSGAIFNLLNPEKDSSIAIFGMGAVGISALFAAKHLNVSQIVVVDVVPAKLELALELGATHTFNARDPDVVEQIKKITKYNGGVKYAVECSGSVPALKTAWEVTANRGHLVSCGTPGPGVNPPFGIFENLLAAKTYTGLTEGDSNPPEFIPFLIDLYNKGAFPVDKISKTFPAAKLEEAVHAMQTGLTVKPILVFD
ncbi:hypothetical protein JCM10207_001840 [Rhodosporidiobolus poonsookiae]